MNKTEHLLVILSEECAELIKEVSKALRFGLEDSEPNQIYTNKEKISQELGDIIGVANMLADEYIIDLPFPEHIKLKQKKVRKYMEYAESKGTLKTETQ